MSQQKTIVLPDDVLLSSAQLVVNDDYLGIFDRSQKLFLLYDHETGEFLTKINASDSFPGFNWTPIQPKLLENEVFFTNSAPWGVYITYDNTVTQVAGHKFLATSAYDFVHDSLYIGFYTQHNGEHELRGVDRDDQLVLRFDKVQLEFPNLAYRSDEKNQVLYHEDYIYFLSAYTNTIYVFNLSGQLERSFALDLEGFLKPGRDLRKVPGGNTQKLIQDWVQVTKGRSVVNRIYALSDNELLIMGLLGYVDQGKEGFVTRVNFENQNTESKIVGRSDLPSYVHNGKVYFVNIESEPVIVRVFAFSDYWLNPHNKTY